MGGYDDYDPVEHELAEIADNAQAEADLIELARAAQKERTLLGNPSRFCPTRWPESFTAVYKHLGESSAEYALRTALKVLNGIDAETIHKAAFQLQQTFDWIHYADEAIADGPDGLGYYPARDVLDGPLQYMEYCVSELPASDAVDEELGPDADDAMLYAILSVSLFVSAAQLHLSKALSEKFGAPFPHVPEYSDIIGTACYAASEAKNRRAMNELRARLPIQAEAAQAAARTKQSKEANAARHRETRKAKELVLKWWNEGDYAKFAHKADAADADYYPAALEAEGLLIGGKPFKSSTVATWLAEGRAAEGKAKT